MMGWLGPGLILVGSIVGSGELIMTTKLGAQAGFVLLWFVVLSCVIKTPVQAELGRHVISSGETVLVMFNKLPGPRGRRPVWLGLPWLTIVVFSSLFGIAALSWFSPTGTDDTAGGWLLRLALVGLSVLATWFVAAYWLVRRWQPAQRSGEPEAERPLVGWFLWVYLGCQLVMFINSGAVIGGAGQALELGLRNWISLESWVWTVGIAVFCGLLLLSGRYSALERGSLVMVSLFTLTTLVCVVLLGRTKHALQGSELLSGFSFSLIGSPGEGVSHGDVALTTLGMYAATGIGTWEMMHYTYWCVEKGYARHAGANQPGEAWVMRARGWVRVMYTDALLTMVVFTISTICFFILGASILYPDYDPNGLETLRLLQRIFTDSLGSWAAALFVIGGFVVLFSTTFSGTAGTSRLVADAMGVIGVLDAKDYAARLRFSRIWIVFGLSMGCLTYYLIENPPLMLIISGFVSVVMYPIFGLGTIYLSYRRVDPRLRPGRLASTLLWICGISLAIISPVAAAFGVALKQGWIVLPGT